MSCINKNNEEILTFCLSEMKVHPCEPLGPRPVTNGSRNNVQLSLVSASTTTIDIGYMLLLAPLQEANINSYHMLTPIFEAIFHGFQGYVHSLESTRYFGHRSLNHQKDTTPNICASNCCTIVS
jgi:hypothetical protein